MASKIQNNNTSLEEILATINALPEEGSGGVELPELSNPGSASTMLSGTEMIDGSGNKVTGTIETKTSSNLTVSGATVTVPTGYYASQATKSVATATQATPSVSIDSAGKITATATQTAGYVNAGTKTGTKQLTTQAAKTIVPSTSIQIAVEKDVYTTGDVIVTSIPSSYVKPTSTKAATTYTPTTSNQTIAAGTYCSGTQTIKGDANLVAGNIAKGVSIFNVTGTHEGGEDVSSETAEYTSLLTNLETAIDALPDAGSGGGNVETCTVSVPSGLSINNTYFSDGKQVIENDTTLSSSNGVITVAKNSIVILEFTSITATNALEVIGDATLMLKYNKYLSLNVAGDCSIVGAGGPA